MWECFVVIIYYVHIVGTYSIGNYLYQREQLISQSIGTSIGSHILFTEDEVLVNEILMQYKNQELVNGVQYPETFLPSNNFFQTKEFIERSCVFKILRKLPKGGSLHGHSKGMVSRDYTFNNLTYRDNLYIRASDSSTYQFKFFKNNPGLPWFPLSNLRLINSDIDNKLKDALTIVRKNPEEVYTTINSVWRQFEKVFKVIGSLVSFKPIFEEYFYQCLLEQYEDNIKYIELRMGIAPLYDLDGRQYNIDTKLDILQQISNRFQKDYPDFWGLKIIISTNRNIPEEKLEYLIEIVQKLMKKYPDFVIGFDLVGQEDPGKPLLEHLPILMKAKEQNMKFFFHAGETAWGGQPSDLNLFDAILLNTTRIGHAYGLLKHPELLRLVKERSIGLEINPISNQVLGLVKDLRNHPASYLIANNFPVVVTSDDPGIWGAKGLSYDWYYAFMALASSSGDLRLLKQLAINSILFSGVKQTNKVKMFAQWNNDWKRFLNDVINDKMECGLRKEYYKEENYRFSN